MDVTLSNIAVWGLGFALLNLVITAQKHLRDTGTPKTIRIVVIAGTAILVAYALAIGVFAAFLLLGGAETAEMRQSKLGTAAPAFTI